MKPLTAPAVEKAWNKMQKLSRPAGAKMMEQMGQEQPVILAYLGSVDQDSLNEGERGILVYLGMFLWQAMKHGAGILPQVSDADMVQAEDATVKQLESLGHDEEDASAGISAIIQSCGQPDLMDLALDALMEAAGYDEEDELEQDASGDQGASAEPERDEADGDESVVRADNVPLIMLNLKTVVDVLNR